MLIQVNQRACFPAPVVKKRHKQTHVCRLTFIRCPRIKKPPICWFEVLVVCCFLQTFAAFSQPSLGKMSEIPRQIDVKYFVTNRLSSLNTNRLLEPLIHVRKVEAVLTEDGYVLSIYQIGQTNIDLMFAGDDEGISSVFAGRQYIAVADKSKMIEKTSIQAGVYDCAISLADYILPAFHLTNSICVAFSERFKAIEQEVLSAFSEEQRIKNANLRSRAIPDVVWQYKSNIPPCIISVEFERGMTKTFFVESLKLSSQEFENSPKHVISSLRNSSNAVVFSGGYTRSNNELVGKSSGVTQSGNGKGNTVRIIIIGIIGTSALFFLAVIKNKNKSM